MSETLSDIVSDTVDARAHRVLELCCARELKLATAESCTGGLLSSLLTDVEGASHAFDRGFVTYSEAAKADLLGVPTALIDEKGAVSPEVAVAMAEGAIARSRADIAVAITGFAGPAGPEDEIGLVHFACARRERTTTGREEHFGPRGRGPVRLSCLSVALEMIEAAIG